MCGISGIVDYGCLEVDKEKVQAITKSLAHRGPDDEGYYYGKHVGLGHRRLSVIDIAAGKQPMCSINGKSWIVYNGEIYNYRELREELKKSGYEFKTSSDTEVLLKSYEKWGIYCLEKLNGMFAFAIWDSSIHQLFIARDRIGIKPLVYQFNGNRLIFASEIKSLILGMDKKPEIDHFGEVSYLLLQYIPGDRTIFKNVKRLLPGEAALFSKEGFKKWKWWSIDNAITAKSENEDEMLRYYINESVRMRLNSDVPLGAFLSGGIDSSFIVGTMVNYCKEKTNTYQVSFEEPSGYDETFWAQIVSSKFKTNHKRKLIKPEKLEGMILKIAAGMGEPVADPAIIPTYILSSFARKEVSVVLTGEGGDELFAGYFRYRMAQYASAWRLIPGWVRKVNRKMAEGFPNADRWTKAIDALNAYPGPLAHFASVRVMDPAELSELTPGTNVPEIIEEIVAHFEPYYNNIEKKGDLRCSLECDLNTWLPCDLLTKVDLMSMAHGLEARVPFLDHRIVEWASGLNPSELMNCREGKLILKKSGRNIIPKKVLNRSKRGLDVPLDFWFRGPLRSFLSDAMNLTAEKMNLSKNIVEKWTADEISGRRNYGLRLFSLSLLGLWMDGLN